MSINEKLQSNIIFLSQLTNDINTKRKNLIKIYNINLPNLFEINYTNGTRKIFINKISGEYISRDLVGNRAYSYLIDLTNNDIKDMINIIYNSGEIPVKFYKFFYKIILNELFKDNTRKDILIKWFEDRFYLDMHNKIAEIAENMWSLTERYVGGIQVRCRLSYTRFKKFLKVAYIKYYNIYNRGIFPPGYTKKIPTKDSDNTYFAWSNFMERLTLINLYNNDYTDPI
jgi:hypothetical protein